MGQKEDNLFNKAKKSLKVRLSLVMLVMVGIVFAGIGLMVYFYVLKEESHPLAGPMFVGLLILGLAIIVFLMIRSARNMKELGEITAVKERMENELEIARGIQMSMIPKIFPPYPDRGDIDIFASIVPAKEVGGDLFDFFIMDEKLYFCIGASSSPSARQPPPKAEGSSSGTLAPTCATYS